MLILLALDSVWYIRTDSNEMFANARRRLESCRSSVLLHHI